MSSSERTRYLIVGMARSGTTATHGALYGHPNICAMAGEFRVDPFFTKGVAAFTWGGESQWERSHGYYNLFDAVTIYPAGKPDPEGKHLVAYSGTNAVPKARIHANGLKVALPDSNDAKLLADSLQEFFGNLKIIHVRRRDWVSQCASLERAMKSGVWHSWHRGSGPAGGRSESWGGKIIIPTAAFTSYVKMALQIESHLERLRRTHDVCEFSYEDDLVGNPTGCWARLFEFLGVEPMQPTWLNSTKVAPPVEEFVENVAELRGILRSYRP